MLRKSLSVLVAVVVLFVASSGYADPASTVWVGVIGGYHTYAMSDVNNGIDDLNAQIDESQLSMSHLSSGLGMGGQIGVSWPTGVSISVGYERLAAHTDVGDASATIEYKLPANAFSASVEYLLPGTDAARFGLGASLGMVSADGQLKVTVPGTGSESGDITGSGVLAEARFLGQFAATPRLLIVPMVGYRYAKTGDLKFSGQLSTNTADYSGLAARLAVRIVMN